MYAQVTIINHLLTAGLEIGHSELNTFTVSIVKPYGEWGNLINFFISISVYRKIITDGTLT